MTSIIILSGVYLTVGVSKDTTFMNQEIIKFDRVITNVGGGYIDDVNNIDYGKFIAPENGTYQFNANFYKDGDKTIGADILKNSQFVLAAKNGNGGATSPSVILDLNENDEVYLTRPPWVSDYTKYDKYWTSFSGFLVRVDV